MANAKLICALLLCTVVTAPMFNIVASIPCHTVQSELKPCLAYLTSGKSVPSAACCRGVQNVNNAARTTKDRRDTCSCLKTAANQNGIKFKFAAALPRICKVKIPYRISASIDCSRIK